jgi:MYXO-CTERM domain-containing protein
MGDYLAAGSAGQGGQASSVVAYESQIMSFVPEPGSMALGLGGAVLLLSRRRSERCS